MSEAMTNHEYAQPGSEAGPKRPGPQGRERI
jgi:hypothetical protein